MGKGWEVEPHKIHYCSVPKHKMYIDSKYQCMYIYIHRARNNSRPPAIFRPNLQNDRFKMIWVGHLTDQQISLQKTKQKSESIIVNREHISHCLHCAIFSRSRVLINMFQEDTDFWLLNPRI